MKPKKLSPLILRLSLPMKIKKVIPLMMALLFTHSPVFADDKRQLIISGVKGEKFYEEALLKLNTFKSELHERDVEIIKKKSSKFSIRLIGKDGTEKWQSDGRFEVKEITQLVDQMPMRRQEIRQKNSQRQK